MDQLAQEIKSLRHHITGNGGKGILQRIAENETDIDFIRGNYVEKTECRNNRVTDYSNVEKEFQYIKNELKKITDTKQDDRRANLMIAGIIASSLFSAAGLFLAISGGV